MSSTSLSSVNLAPTITSLGVGSGLDLNSIVTSLVAVERQPITQLQAAATALQTHISDFGQISSLMSTLSSAALALQSPTLWMSQSASSSNGGAVSATAGTGATSGNYAVTVQSLASAQTVVSALNSNTTPPGNPSYASATALVGSGTLTFQVGANNTPIEVTSSDTVQSLANKINSMGMGVTASLVTDSSGVRLALSSTQTGTAHGFSIASADPSLSALTYPASGGMQLASAAADASATINGIPVTSSSNTIAGAVNGVTLTLSQTTSTPVNVAVSTDQSSISNAVQSFVSAFNGIASYLQSSTAYNASTKVAGDLQGDSAANGLQRLLRAALGATSGASGVFKSLSDVGLQFQKDGTLSIDQSTLSSALNNLPELKKAFSSISTTTPGNSGFATKFFNLAQQVLGTNGLVTTATTSLQAQLAQNADRQTALNNRVAAYQQTLLAQYSALDGQLGQLSSLNSYVTQQLAAMAASNSSSSS